MTDYEKNCTESEEEKNGMRSISTDEYYTKAAFDALLAQKAEASDAELETYEMYPDWEQHPDWKVSFQRLGMGVVTVTVEAPDLAASVGDSDHEYMEFITNIPERFRPNYHFYFVGSDNRCNSRTIGMRTNGKILIYCSVSAGCYGSMTYVANH